MPKPVESVERTFAIIKPDAVQARHVGEIIQLVELEGFDVRTVVQARPNRQAWAAFYEEHAGRHFFDELTTFMASGPVVLLVLEAGDVVARWRRLMGATDPRAARAGTVRHRFGDKAGVVYRNAVHGSDSAAAAEREQAFFFSPQGVGQAAEVDARQMVERYLPLLKDGEAMGMANTYGALLRLLAQRVGERGDNEGAVEVLERLMREVPRDAS